MSTKEALALSKTTYTKWSEHNATRLGASVAFYSLLSFAPLLLLTTAVIALILGQSSAQGVLVDEARQLMGDHGAETVQTLLKSAQKPSSGILASLIAFITLLYGASGVFSELQSALNLMWDAPEQTTPGVSGFIKDRLLSFGMVLSIGFLLLVSLILSTGLAFVGKQFGQITSLPTPLLETFNFLVSFAVITVLFTLMYKYVPNVKVHWRESFIGALGTALMFTIGKFLLGVYLGKASVGSTYGAAGSLVAVIVWIYYSAQIFFFGAEFTRVYAEHIGALQTARKSVPPPEPAVTEKAAAAFAAAGAKPAVPTTVVPTPKPIVKGPEQLTAALQPAAPPAVVPALKPIVKEPEQLTVTQQPFPPAPAGRTVPVTKQKLVLALGMGFILGRLFSGVRSRNRFAAD